MELGYPKDLSTVTVMRAESVVNVTGGLAELASVMGSAASSFAMIHSGKVAVALAPHVAQRLAREGWSKDDVKRHLYHNGRMTAAAWEKSWLYGLGGGRWPAWLEEAARQGSIPAVRAAEDITVIVAGGNLPIPQHAYFPSWGFPPCRITKVIGSAGGLVR